MLRHGVKTGRFDSEAKITRVAMRGLLSDLPSLAWPTPSTETQSLPEQIAERIGNAIVKGELEPGSRVQEQEVADRFKVSRGPVREALRILEHHGLIQINARKGAQVTKLSADEVRQIFEIRINLVGLAAKLVAERQDPEFTQQFKLGTEHMTKLAKTSGSLDEYVTASYRLNLLMVEASHNSFLRNIIFSLALQTLRYTRLGLSTEKRRQQSAKNYRILAQMIVSGDAAGAQRAAEQLVRDSRDTAVEQLKQQSQSR